MTPDQPINSFCQFDPLEEVWIGDCWPSEFYSDYDPAVRSAFERITEITKEDLDNLASILKSLNVTVQRPQFATNSDVYRDAKGVLYKPPITPRDDNIVLGNTLYQLRQQFQHNPWLQANTRYQSLGGQVEIGAKNHIFSNLVCSSVVRLGHDIFIDTGSHQHDWDFFINQVIPKLAEDYRINLCSTSGHSDSVFCPVRSGLILASHWKDDYSKEYPGWSVHHIPKMIPPKNMHRLRPDKSWFMQDLEGPCNKFNEHILQCALDWIGYSEETVFEVNSLVVNPNLIITTGEPDHTTKAWFKNNHVEYIACPIRCRHFWDGGVHCLTVDIKRQGEKRDLFGNKSDKIYWY